MMSSTWRSGVCAPSSGPSPGEFIPGSFDSGCATP
jgi:hypothetical protein